jgi:ABC-type oligopeptide transport system substrate-binding subunit
MRVADIVRNDLASIGIRVDIESEPDPYQMVDKGGRFDLVLASSSILYPDPASFLSELLRDAPAGWLPHQTISDVRGLDGTTGTRRAERAAALASRLVREHLVIPFGIPQTSQFIGPRIGCRVFSPVSFGLDLTASCRA